MGEIVSFSGLDLRFLQTGDGTAGSLDVFEMAVQPNARMPVPHYHETWDETIYGVAGTTIWRIAGSDVAVGPGESVFIRRGVIHGFRNASDTPATCLRILTPGLLGPAYFRAMAALVATGSPDPVAMKAVMTRYGLIPAPAA